jgi:hypothetical protein
MTLLAILAIPAALGFLFMGIVITRKTLIGGRSWKP